MGSNIHLKQKAIALRKKGNSYGFIRNTLGIKSKGTLSHWFKDLVLSEESTKLLEKNNLIAHKKGLFNANKNRALKIQIENKKSYESGNRCVNRITKNDLILIGAALYWGEGMKSEKRTSTTLIFTNSDPRMISIYLRFVREILKVKEEKIRAGIHIYFSITPSTAQKFWSSVTKLPEDRFYIVNQVSRASLRKRPFNSLPYGTAVIKINSRIQFYKVKGMIEGIINRLK